MSIYIPDPAKCHVGERRLGWYIYDEHGVLDGPYKSRFDAVSVLSEWERESREERQRWCAHQWEPTGCCRLCDLRGWEER